MKTLITIFLAAFLALCTGAVFAQTLTRPADVAGNAGINNFVHQSFAIYDSTFTLDADVDSLEVEVTALEASIKSIDNDAASTASGAVSDAKNTSTSSVSDAKSDASATVNDAKNDTQNAVNDRQTQMNEVEMASDSVKANITELTAQVTKMLTDGPTNISNAVSSVTPGMKAIKEIAAIKSNGQTALNALEASKTELGVQAARLDVIKQRIAALKK